MRILVERNPRNNGDEWGNALFLGGNMDEEVP
jgi:hypothetical protein